MHDSNVNQGTVQYACTDTSICKQKNSKASKNRKSISMHDGISASCDCCSCEAEPYWLEVAEELGIDPGNGYEDVDTNG